MVHINPLRQNFCHSDPCPVRNFLCQVGFTDKGYRCVCRYGFKGDNCEGMATLFNFAFSTVVCYRAVCVTLSTSRPRNVFTYSMQPPVLAFIESVKHYCWFSHDVTKIQTTKLSILPRFYLHYVLEQLKTNFHTNFLFKRVLGFVIEYALISKLLRDTAFT